MEQLKNAWIEKNIVENFPLGLDIELTNRCNLKCERCPFHGNDVPYPRKDQDMDFEIYQKIINEGHYKGLKSVKLNYGGEPLLYPYIIKAIEYAKYKNILDVQLNTNGLLLTNKMCLNLINSGLDLLILTDYDLPTQKINIVKLITLRDAQGAEKPFVRVKTNNWSYWGDIVDELSYDEIFEYSDISKDYSESDFKCTQPWQRMLVLADGMVCKCSCGSLDPNKMMNYVDKMSIEMMWQSMDMIFIRKCHESKCSHLVSMCQSCAARKAYIQNRR